MSFIGSLHNVVNDEWGKIKQGKFWTYVLEHPVTKEFYHDLLVEIYHYTSHNARNQAIAAFVPGPEGLHKFAYHHAYEEHGHEKMVIHDLDSIGMLDQNVLEKMPLPATEALVGYLYAVSMRYGAKARLGYSFWAENVYCHINEILQKTRSDLNLTDKNMSFFVAHAKIDDMHSKEVEECILKYVDTNVEKNLLTQVTKTTLFLTGAMLDQIVGGRLESCIINRL